MSWTGFLVNRRSREQGQVANIIIYSDLIFRALMRAMQIGQALRDIDTCLLKWSDQNGRRPTTPTQTYI